MVVEIEVEIGGVVAETEEEAAVVAKTEIEDGLTQATAADEPIILDRARAPVDAR